MNLYFIFLVKVMKANHMEKTVLFRRLNDLFALAATVCKLMMINTIQ